MQNVTNASALRACITYSLVLLRTLVGTLPLRESVLFIGTQFSKLWFPNNSIQSCATLNLSSSFTSLSSRNAVLHPRSWLLILSIPLRMPQNSGYYVPAHFPSCVS
jgi:hypothetical protein